MGYASPSPKTAGIHTRQYSRAFVVDDGVKHVVFVSVDCAMIDQIVKTEVCKSKKQAVFSVWRTSAKKYGHFLRAPNCKAKRERPPAHILSLVFTKRNGRRLRLLRCSFTAVIFPFFQLLSPLEFSTLT